MIEYGVKPYVTRRRRVYSLHPLNFRHEVAARRDDPILSDALCAQLQGAGYQVEHAPNGAVTDYLLHNRPSTSRCSTSACRCSTVSACCAICARASRPCRCCC